ncbi:CASP-like protein 1B2 [Aristolochia californica]|uniref:CASP-like protein 1B2 n=1 Tax=Aristolochia californica TaxID=171875 RepID=UPI0035E11148
MAGEDVEKQEGEVCTIPPKANKVKERDWWVLLALRLLALFATVAATLVMALNKETKTVTVGIIGTQPVRQSLTAKFQQTPAFVFFVVANAIASFHNLTMLLLILLEKKINFKGLGLLRILADLFMVALVTAGSAAAAAMAELGKSGNSHARWNKICDKFDAYCDRGGGALLASYAGIGFLIALTVISIVNLYKNQAATTHCS